MNVSPNILAKNQNFRKVRHGFVDERALITTTLISSCHWKPLYLFVCERKDLKRIFNTNSELSQNRTEKQIMPLKQTVDCFFNNIYYLVISCFD